MKALKFEFIRDWKQSNSVPGTGEVELSDYGRAPDVAVYVVDSEYNVELARTALMQDYKWANPSDITLVETSDVKGIVYIQRRL